LENEYEERRKVRKTRGKVRKTRGSLMRDDRGWMDRGEEQLRESWLAFIEIWDGVRQGGVAHASR